MFNPKWKVIDGACSDVRMVGWKGLEEQLDKASRQGYRFVAMTEGHNGYVTILMCRSEESDIRERPL